MGGPVMLCFGGRLARFAPGLCPRVVISAAQRGVMSRTWRFARPPRRLAHPTPAARSRTGEWRLRLSCPARPRAVVGMGSICFLLAASQAAAGGAARDAPNGVGFGLAVAVQYVFQGDDPVRPVLSVGSRMGLAIAPSAAHPFALHYKLDVGAAPRPENRVDLARSLLLPGALALTVGATHGWGNAAGTRVVVPRVSLGAKVVPWHGDTTALKLGLSGGLGFSANHVFDASVLLTRAVNAVGIRGQKRLLAASNSPDLWASDVSVTAAIQSPRRGIGVFGAFGAYLFDSKFHVPPDARSVFSLGVRKTFG